MKPIILFFLFFLSFRLSQAQIQRIVNLRELDSIFNLNSNGIHEYILTAKVISFGKSRTVPLNRLDSLGILSSNAYSTSFLVSLFEDSAKYYAPVKSRVFRIWKRKYFNKNMPLDFGIVIEVYDNIRFTDGKHFFTIKKIMY